MVLRFAWLKKSTYYYRLTTEKRIKTEAFRPGRPIVSYSMSAKGEKIVMIKLRSV